MICSDFHYYFPFINFYTLFSKQEAMLLNFLDLLWKLAVNNNPIEISHYISNETCSLHLDEKKKKFRNSSISNRMEGSP